jgi:hypothetical protein
VLSELILRQDIYQLKTAPPSQIPQEVASGIAEWVRLSSFEALYQAIPFLFKLVTPVLGRALLERIIKFSQNEINRIVSAANDRLRTSLAESVVEAVKTGVSWKTIPSVAAWLLEESLTWSSVSQAQAQLLQSLRVLLHTPNREQSDLANVECARLALAARSGIVPAITADEIDKSAVLRYILSGTDDLVTIGIEFLVTARSHDHITSLLSDLNRISEPQCTVLESKLRESGEFGVEVVGSALSKSPLNKPILELACNLFSSYLQAASRNEANVLLNGLLNAVEKASDEDLLIITRSIVSLQVPDIADSLIARLLILDQKTAQTMLELQWPCASGKAA